MAEENWTIVRIVPSQSLHANLLHLDLLAIHLRNEGRADLCVWFIVEPSAKIGRGEGGGSGSYKEICLAAYRASLINLARHDSRSSRDSRLSICLSLK